MDDCLIIGGGVVGLSLAYELASHGLKTRVVDRATPGREASWAGAGLLPPTNRATATDAYEELAGLSSELHPLWAERLREETGIDNGFRRTGSIHVARTAEDAALLAAAVALWRDRKIEVHELAPAQLFDIEPGLATAAGIQAAALLPGEAQVRNPRHLKALVAACARRGVGIETGVAVEDVTVRDGRIAAVTTSLGQRTAGAYCLASGAWSGQVARRLPLPMSITPVRGQMLLLAAPAPPVGRIVNEGRRYIVPRPDGRVLVGSTEEWVGFDKRPTAEGIGGLLRLGIELVPGLSQATVEASWAGLRPGTPDGMPYLGALPGIANGFVATGHFRGGLHQSTGTAVAVGQLIRGEKPEIDLAMFRVDRAAPARD